MLLGVPAPAGSDGLTVTGVTQDSAHTRVGDLYVGRPGARTHGARFAAQAASAGAAAALTDQAGVGWCTEAGLPTLVVADPRAVLGAVSDWAYGHPASDLSILGVTGTNGKTTTVYLLEAALRQAGQSTGVVGTVETRVGAEVVPSARSTPEAPDLHALLAVMREQRVDAVSMEVSSHALALGRVAGVDFDVVGFTNLTRDHLEFHGDMESYFAAKAELFHAGRARVGVINIDDPYGARLAGIAGVPVVTVSPSGQADADWRAIQLGCGPAGTPRFGVEGPAGVTLNGTLAVAGEFNVANALLALAMVHETGVSPTTAMAGIETASVPGRMERVDGGQDFTVLVDYAHTADAIAGVLAAVRPWASGRVIVVVGCGGDRDTEKRPSMGAAAAEGADVVVITDDNPRSEDPARIRAAALEGARQVPASRRGEIIEIGDRRAAITWALDHARGDDTVLVLGKGHEQGQEIAGVKHPFDDRAVVREALAGGESCSR